MLHPYPWMAARSACADNFFTTEHTEEHGGSSNPICSLFKFKNLNVELREGWISRASLFSVCSVVN